mgnify:FL=1|jgi:hypothetical protein
MPSDHDRTPRVTAILLDVIVLGGFIWVKITSDPIVIGVAALAMVVILFVESVFLANNPVHSGNSHHHHGN